MFDLIKVFIPIKGSFARTKLEEEYFLIRFFRFFVKMTTKIKLSIYNFSANSTDTNVFLLNIVRLVYADKTY